METNNGRNMKYVILAYSNDETFEIPRQLVEVKGEPLVKRTIRLLKENGVENIVLSARKDKFNNLGVEVYDPKENKYDYKTGKGYWLDAFPFDLLNEPVCFIWGDVYFSENAIKTIVRNNTESALFFCTYKNGDARYIKHHDEPLAYKVVDYEMFKEHINIVKKRYDNDECCRNPIVWELYRDINNIYINEHVIKENCIVINDESCDIDSEKDLITLNEVLGGGNND